MEEKRYRIATISLTLALLGGGLLVLTWWGLFTQTELLRYFFTWPEGLPDFQGKLHIIDTTLGQIALYGSLTLFFPICAMIVGRLERRQQKNGGQRRRSPGLILGYSFTILAVGLLLCTLCGVWSSTFFVFN